MILEALFTQLQLEEIWDKVPGLLVRSKIYPILDACHLSPNEGPHSETKDCRVDVDITEEDVLNSLGYNYGNAAGDKNSKLPYTICLQYLLKSKLKYSNSQDFRQSNSSFYYNNSRYPSRLQKHPTGPRLNSKSISFQGKLTNLTKHVQKLKRRSKYHTENNQDSESSLTPTSSSEDNTSCDSYHETTDNQEKRHTKRERKSHRVVVPTKYLHRHHIFRGDVKSKILIRRNIQRKCLRRNQFLWSQKCCSNKPVLNSTNGSWKSFWQFVLVILFFVFCIRIYIDTKSQLDESFHNHNYLQIHR